MTQTLYHILRAFKRIALYNIREKLAESLVPTKTNYGNVVFANIPKLTIAMGTKCYCKFCITEVHNGT